MKNHTAKIIALLFFVIGCVNTYSQMYKPVAIDYRIIPKAHTFVGYGSTPLQAMANMGGVSGGITTFNPSPKQIAPNIWVSRKVVIMPTIDPVYSKSSIQKYLNNKR